MLRFPSKSLNPFGLALLADGISFCLIWLLQPIIAPTNFALFYPAILITSLYGGFKAGLLATAIAALITKYVFIADFFSLRFAEMGDFFRLIALVAIALMTVSFTSTLLVEKRRAEKTALRLKESEDLFQQFMVHSPVTAFIKDAAGRYLYVNPLSERLFQRELADWLGKTDYDLFPQAVAREIRKNDKTVMASGQPIKAVEVYPQDGGDRHLMSFKFPLRDQTGAPILAGMALDITDSLRTEEALRESETRFNRLAETNLMGFITWTLGNEVTEANDAFLQMIGYSREELESGKIQWQDMTPPEYREVDTNAIRELLQFGINTPFEKEFIRKDGSRVSVILGSTFLERSQTTGVSFVLDITARKQTEDALRQSELNFRTLANTLPQLVWTTLPNGYCDYFNDRWCNYTGLTLEQSQGWGWGDVLHPDDRDRSIATWRESVQTGKDYTIEYRLRSGANNRYRWFLGQAFPLRNHAGEIVKWFGTCTDIHDQKIVLAERDQALEREQAAREQAERANRVKDEFLAVLSHELRSPLNPILGWTHLLRTRKFDQQGTERALEIIERNAKLQTQLIEDLLDISRILRGKMALNINPVNLVNVIEGAIETVRLSAEAKQIQIHTQFEPNVGLVDGDAARLQQIVWNLLSNAVKFTPANGRITIYLTQIDDKAQIQVTDTGQGISADFLPHVFDYFRQEDGKITRKFGGLGLGLAIVRHLTELHGGTVAVESQGENNGATFTVRLPLGKTPAAAVSLVIRNPDGKVALF
jgi:PAS domain S-box-containing protein